MIVVVLFVLLINGLVKKNWLEAFLFSISVAVGITPGMLPMIVNGTLAKGAKFLAKKKTIVKNMSANPEFRSYRCAVHRLRPEPLPWTMLFCRNISI